MITDQHDGIYTGAREEDYKSKEQIQIETMYEGDVSVTYPDREIAELSFEELHEEMLRRNELRKKVENKEYSSNIEIQTDHPIGLLWWADVHNGNFHTDLELLKWEAEEIKRNPYMKVALGGDFADSFCWNPAQFEDTTNLTEQNLYLHKMIEYVGYDKVLFAVMGNHCKWARQTGLDMYTDIRKRIPVFDGVGTVKLKINNIEYTGAVEHKPRGKSYLDPNFGGKRFLRETDGYDFVMTAHVHEGGTQTLNRHIPDGEREAVVIAGKTFKETDDFHDTQSIMKHSRTGLGSNGIIFDHEIKEMQEVSCMSKMIKYLK